MKRVYVVKWIFAVIFFWGGIFGTQAQNLVLSIDSLRERIPISDYLTIFHDKTAELSFEEIIQQEAAFRPIADFDSPFERNATYWARVSIQHDLETPSEWMFYLGYPSMAEVYISDQDSGFAIQKSGIFMPHATKSLNEGEMQKVRLFLEPGDQKEVWVKFWEIDQSRPNFQEMALVEFSFWRSMSMEKAHVVMGIFSGMLLIIILYNIILFFTTHSSAHIYYALYLASVLMFVLFASDVMRSIPTEHPTVIPYIGFLSLALVSIFYFQFGRAFLNTSELIPEWDKYLKWYIYLKIGILVLEQGILLTTFYLELVKDIEFSVMFLDVIVSILLIIRLLKTTSKVSRFFIAGSSCVMIFAFALAIFSTIFNFPAAFMFFLIAVVVEILIFSLGLGYKIKMAEHEKLHAQEALTRQLLAADRMKDEFLANTSHELRTPLNGIIGIAESLYDGAAGTPSELMKHNLSMIASSGKRLANLVNDLLDFAKLKSYDLKIEPKAVDMHVLVDLVLMIGEPLVKGKELALINDIPVDFPAVKGDENRLQQILINLIGNGIKFTEQGEVRIEAELEGKKIWIHVEDTGIGIPAENMPVIFQSFEQGDGSIERTYGGTGLGLSITKKLVELHGGTIKVASKVGEGSVFSFCLPISDEKDLQVDTVQNPLQSPAPNQETPTNIDTHHDSHWVKETPVKSTQGSGSIRILVVDDEPVNQQVLKNHLSFGDYHVTSVMNGEDALQVLEQEAPFDLVLLDIMMPRMSGYDVCKKIREKYLPSELPIIMITAKNQVSDLVQGFSYGANDYLTKPFSKDEFLARIKTHLNLFNINAAYGRFVPHEFLKALGQESIMDIKLGDQVEKEVTVFFSDIRSYTTLAETMTPQENFNFINAYLGRMGPIIQQHKGFVNQYYGDGIMALFLSEPEEAVQASIEMQKEVMLYNEKRLPKGRLPIKVGIGLHSGKLMLGIIGDRMRMEAGVVSDTVNTAARMEGLTKYFGVNIIVSGDSYKGLKTTDRHMHRFLGKVLVKGKQEPIAIYDFFAGDSPDLIQLKQRSLSAFEAGVTAYYQKDFASAATAFRQVLEINEADKTAERYLEKCLINQQIAVGKDWTGIEEMTHK
jgi:signal transduction histidine kinase/class 3 adenylate cyclase/ActR/RegA family two-component response regulator